MSPFRWFRLGPSGTPYELLKEATAKYKEKDYDGAVHCLRAAYARIGSHQEQYPVTAFLRLPLYLQKAGRSDEGWREFNRLLVEGYPGQIRKASLIPMDHSQIYDKMRLFLQREKRPKHAIRFGVFSDVSWAIGLKKQRRTDELDCYFEPDNIEDVLTPLLKKAKCPELLEQLIEVVERRTRKLSKVDLAALGKDIDAVVFGERESEGRQSS